MKSAILAGVLAASIFLGGCKSYRDDRKAEADEVAEAAEKLAATGQYKPEQLMLRKSQERMEEVSSTTPTPTPAPNDLFNRPLDPAGLPPH